MRLHALVTNVETAQRAAEGGATVIQLRLKGADHDAALDEADRIREICRAHDVEFTVNDDMRLAVEAEADYLHLGQGDPWPTGISLRIGLSASKVDQAIEAERRGAAYVGAGPVWATPSKPDADPPIGLEGMRAICEAVSIPVVAIGGIDSSNAADCIRAGAAGVAVIRAIAEIETLRAAIDDAR